MTIIVATIIFLTIAFGFVVFWGAPYVPSHRREAEKAFEVLWPLSKKDLLVDLGSGDGVILRLAARKGAKAIGYELNPLLVLLSRLLSRRFSIVEVHTANFWQRHLPKKTTVVYVFSVTRDMAKLEAKLQAEANYQGRAFQLVLYAMKLPTKKPAGIHRAHTLYMFTPLHSPEA